MYSSQGTHPLSLLLASVLMIAGCGAGEPEGRDTGEGPTGGTETPPAVEQTTGTEASDEAVAGDGPDARSPGALAEEAVNAAGAAAAEALRAASEATAEAARSAGEQARDAVNGASEAAREAIKEGERALEEAKRALEDPSVPPEQAPPPAEPRVQATDAAEPVTHTVTANITSFDPMVVFARPGDSIRFTNMAGHNTQSLPGMIPEGAQAWESQLGENYSLTLDVPGAYVYKCAPHASAGMIAAIVVGTVPPENLGSIEASPDNKGMVGRTLRKLRKAIDEYTL
jgi:pseudoazurin